MVVEQVLNNGMTIRYDPKAAPSMKAYKCPYLDCKDFFFDAESLNSHMVLKHAELPKSLMQDSGIGNERYFTVRRVGKLQRYVLQNRWKGFTLGINLYMKESHENAEKKRMERLVKEKETPKPNQKSSFFRRINALLKGG